MDDLCILCDKKLGKDVYKVEKNFRESFIKASIFRRDGKFEILNGLSHFLIHNTCKSNYRSWKNIYICAQKNQLPKNSISSESFNFSRNCFFCAEDASDDLIRLLKRRGKPVNISFVQNPLTRVNLLTKIREFNDPKYNNLKKRLESCQDLIENKARYHRSCQSNFLSSKVKTPDKKKSVQEFILFAAAYIDERKAECQFSFEEIKKKFEEEYGHSPVWSTYLKESLYDFFQGDIVFHSSPDGPILSCRDIKKILSQYWVKKSKGDTEAEKTYFIKESAELIYNDIKSMKYDRDYYELPDDLLVDSQNAIPKSLKLFLDILIQKSKVGKPEPWELKIISIAHVILQCVRPRGFTSNLLLSLSACFDRKFGSKELIDTLFSLGFGCSYDETKRFEASILLNDEKPSILEGSLIQESADNTDWLTKNNDINNPQTFHVMGRILWVTPGQSIKVPNRIKKLKKIPEASSFSHLGMIPVRTYEPSLSVGIAAIKAKDLLQLNPINMDVHLRNAEFSWLAAHHLKSFDYMGLSTFMEQLFTGRQYSVSRIIPLPFIDGEPGNLDTVYTVLYEASKKCKAQKQKHTFVTFDQPLYAKARDIKARCPELENVIIRLGGFHLLLSFLGCIGFIMRGSGLEEVLSTIFGEGSIDQILSGHIYGRAVRVFSLINVVLADLLLTGMKNSRDLIEEDSLFLERMLSDIKLIEKENKFLDNRFVRIKTKFEKYVSKVAKRSPTAKLWVQLFKMTTLVRHFLEAEKSGNWQLHLDTVQKMLPIFHAAGHNKYAEFAHLYLQDMLELRNIMDPIEFQKFTDGFFTVRRTEKFYSGIFSDQTIEQVLMRAIKIKGGLIGRGLSEGVIARWIGTLLALVNVMQRLCEFTGVDYESSEQHKDARTHKIKNDMDAMIKMKDYFRDHPPFPEIDDLISIDNGMKGNKMVNCHNAFEVGLENLRNVSDKTFKKLEMKQKNRVNSLATIFGVTNNGQVVVDFEAIFTKLLKSGDTKSNVYKHLYSELASIPLSLFCKFGFRKTPKSKLYDLFKPVLMAPTSSSIYNVIDGGYLLHKVVWRTSESFKQISEKYINHLSHFAPCSVVFDGYPDTATLKSYERSQRELHHSSRELKFIKADKYPHASQENFLGNAMNKDLLIKFIMEQIKNSTPQIEAHQVYEDADLSIVQTALEAAEKYTECYIIGEDVDLLIILTQLAAANSNVYLKKYFKGSHDFVLHHPKNFQYPSLKDIVMFLHVFCGCDTTSSFSGCGKKEIFKIFHQNQTFIESAKHFYSSDPSIEDLFDFGKNIIFELYSNANSKKLLKELANPPQTTSEYRPIFAQSLKQLSLDKLPPTDGALKQHVLRVYLQCQYWLGHDLDPCDWGWRRNGNIFEPVYSTDPLIPDEILERFHCSCKTGCTKRCSCRKYGLKCGVFCKNCKSVPCSNSHETINTPISENDAEPIFSGLEHIPEELDRSSDDEGMHAYDSYKKYEYPRPVEEKGAVNDSDGTESDDSIKMLLKRRRVSTETEEDEFHE